MSNAKPQSVHADGSDDLIAELARLMATEADGERVPVAPQPVPVPVAPAPAPVAAERPRPHVRIPGDPPTTPMPDVPVRSEWQAPAAPSGRKSGEFDFGFSAPKDEAAAPAPRTEEPARPVPVPTASAPAISPAAPVATASVAPPNPLDHDAIAELIAAEFSAQLAEETADAAADEAPAEPAAAPAPPAPPVTPMPRANPQPMQRQAARVQLVSANPRPVSSGGAQPATVRPIPVATRPAPAPSVTPAKPVAREAAPSAGTSIEPQVTTGDRFGSPPVFGVGGTVERDRPARTEPTFGPPPAPPAVPGARDPIDEIENLIGQAVRLEVQKPVQPAPGPVVAPMASAPARRTMARATEPTAPASIDDAILEAAEDTGTEVDFIQPVAAGKPAKAKRVRDEYEPKPSGARRIVAPLVAATLLVGSALGAYWFLGQGGGTTGVAPVLTPDTAEIKQDPPAVEAVAGTTGGAVVFDGMAGGNTGDETLVSRDQSDPVEVAALSAPVPAEDETVIANRKVRTVTVRPDGTIISGEDSVAGSAALPVDRPEVPEIASTGTRLDASDLLAGVASTLATEQAALAGGATPATATPAAEPTAVTAFADPTAALPIDPNAPVPRARPAWYGTASAPSPSPSPTAAVNAQVAPTADLVGALPSEAPAAAPVVAAAAPASAAAWVQLASQRSEAEAQSTIASLQSRYGSLFGGAELQIQRADLGDRGVYYRVRLPASSSGSAAQICNQIKAAGGDCAVF